MLIVRMFLLTVIAVVGVLSTFAGPLFVPTKGSIWPKPQHQKFSPIVKVVQKKNFNFKISGYQCELICDAITRFKINFSKWFIRRHNAKRVAKAKGTKYLQAIDLKLTRKCSNDEIPTFNMSEKYNLTILEKSDTVEISADSVWGIMHGLTSLSQLFYYSRADNLTLVNVTEINDYPSYSHRGLLLDTSRHYIPVTVIKQTLEAMSINKLNVFHWHMTDDQSFPYESIQFPNLSKFGAYTDDMVYTQQSIRNLVKFAHERGIRVIVEIDTPGHTNSWANSYPQLLSTCTVNNRTILGPLNIAKNYTYDFLKKLFIELFELFSDNFIHLGCDEVDTTCWLNNPKINDFIVMNNISNPIAFYVTQLIMLIENQQKTSIVWEEVFDKNFNFSSNLIFHVWKPDSNFSLLEQIVSNGYRVLTSSCWYLDHLQSGGDWQKFYTCSMFHPALPDKMKRLVLGGESCMWTEVVDEANLNSRVWPRAAASAERLWNYEHTSDVKEAAHRLEEHYCRMKEHGIPAQPPNGPGFCHF